jgi:hypothetical protein
LRRLLQSGLDAGGDISGFRHGRSVSRMGYAAWLGHAIAGSENFGRSVAPWLAAVKAVELPAFERTIHMASRSPPNCEARSIACERPRGVWRSTRRRR